MPVKKLLGDETVTVGDRQVPTVPSAKGAVAPINTDRWYRCGKHPDASAFNDLNDHFNKAMLYRTKEAFSILGDLGSAPGIQATSTGSPRNRWRFAFHVSPYSHALLVRAVMFPPSSNYGNDTHATLKIYSDAAESSLVSTTEFHYGPGPAGAVSVGGWQYHKVIDRFVDGLTADTDYYAVIADHNFGRIQSIAGADLQSMSENYSGYLPCNFTEQTPIVDEYRQNIVQLQVPLWKRCGSKVLNWTSNIQVSSPSTASATAINILTGAAPSYGAAEAGYTLDMRGKARLSQTSGVPCIMKASMSCTSASNGLVHLRDSSGTIVATCTNTGGAGAVTWISSGAFNLPATTSKYYLTHQTAAGTLTTQAVSIYEHEA